MFVKLALCAATAAAVVSAQAPKQTPAGDAGKGKAVFTAHCSVCHAQDASDKLGPGIKGLFKRAKPRHGKVLSEISVRAWIDAGGGGMPPYKDLLTPAQKDDLIAYLKTL
jgi:mono/diheme cytochrome c family protein